MFNMFLRSAPRVHERTGAQWNPVHAARLKENKAEIFEGGGLRQLVRHHMPHASHVQPTSVLVGLMVNPRPLQQSCMLVRRDCSPGELQDSRATSSAYAREGTHQQESSCTPACGACISR